MNDVDNVKLLLKYVASTDTIVFTWFYSLLAVGLTVVAYLSFYMAVSYFAPTHMIFMSLLGAAVVPYVILYSLTFLVIIAGIAGLVLPEISGVDAIKKASDALHKTAKNVVVPTIMVVATINVVDFFFGFRAPVFLTLGMLGLLIGIGAWAEKFNIDDTLYKHYAGLILFTQIPVLIAYYAMKPEQSDKLQSTVTGGFSYLSSNWIPTTGAIIVLLILIGNPFSKK